jgi:D-cysteine desulfhydrase
VTAAVTPPVAEPLALERRYPQIGGRFPRVGLTTLPTRVHLLPQLARHGGVANLWIKRDDESGPLYGGNKPRKLEFLLGEARAEGKTAVLTFGGIGTHHGLATAVCARAAGLRTILVLLAQPVTEHVRHNLLLDHAAGAEMHFAPGVARVTARAVRLCVREWLRGGLPSIIPAGGTSPLGALGYVNAAFELAEQVAAGALPEPDDIFVPLGTGGTVAGLVLGAKLAGLRTRVHAVLVTDILPPSAAKVAALANRSLGLLRECGAAVPALTVAAGDVAIVTGFLGAAYGAPTEVARQARVLMEQLEGVHLETTYTAKCLAAMLAAARSGGSRDRTVLFWNTYSSVDPGTHLGPLPDYRALPRPFHRFFTGPVVAE